MTFTELSITVLTDSKFGLIKYISKEETLKQIDDLIHILTAAPASHEEKLNKLAFIKYGSASESVISIIAAYYLEYISEPIAIHMLKQNLKVVVRLLTKSKPEEYTQYCAWINAT